MRTFLSLALIFACVVRRTNASEDHTIDPRLGPPFVKRERAVLGVDTAKVVVIEFSSFKCTHCLAFHEEIFPRLRKHYIDTGKVQWVIINASNDAADQSSPVFLVARNAVQHGSYWQRVDRFYQVGLRPPDVLSTLVGEAPSTSGDNVETLLHDPALRKQVAEDFSEYAQLSLRGTPTFLIRKVGSDGRWTRGIIEDIQPIDYFQRTFDALLNKP